MYKNKLISALKKKEKKDDYDETIAKKNVDMRHWFVNSLPCLHYPWRIAFGSHWRHCRCCRSSFRTRSSWCGVSAVSFWSIRLNQVNIRDRCPPNGGWYWTTACHPWGNRWYWPSTASPHRHAAAAAAAAAVVVAVAGVVVVVVGTERGDSFSAAASAVNRSIRRYFSDNGNPDWGRRRCFRRILRTRSAKNCQKKIIIIIQFGYHYIKSIT